MHSAYAFNSFGHLLFRSPSRSAMHAVTALPSRRHASGFLSFFLHARYAALRLAHFDWRCLCTLKRTLDVALVSSPVAAADIVARLLFSALASSPRVCGWGGDVGGGREWGERDDRARGSKVLKDRRSPRERGRMGTSVAIDRSIVRSIARRRRDRSRRVEGGRARVGDRRERRRRDERDGARDSRQAARTSSRERVDSSPLAAPCPSARWSARDARDARGPSSSSTGDGATDLSLPACRWPGATV
eukprot:30861-Pelagococcus_subviridis.AAC.15